jgi:hypothetical protein
MSPITGRQLLELQNEIDQSKATARIAQVIAMIAVVVAVAAVVGAWAIRPKPFDSSHLIERVQTMESGLIKRFEDFQQQSQLSLTDIKAHSLTIGQVKITESSIAVKSKNGRDGWVVLDVLGTVSSHHFGPNGGQVQIDGGTPKIQIDDKDGKTRTIVGSSYLSDKDGEETVTSPASIIFYRPDGTVMQKLPFGK